MQDIRCKCNKLLFKVRADKSFYTACELESKTTTIHTFNGDEVEIECKCPRCGQIVTIFADKI